MSDIAIRVENLGKQYRIGKRERYRTLRDSLTDAVSAPYRRIGRLLNKKSQSFGPGDETIWALKDVCFEIPRGEVVGVIGRNGAGKSTLLKILSRITDPTEGHVEIHGRVGSLLEVGTGFHAELTGRENIFLNGAILGMKRAEIIRKFDEIVTFAEIEKFIDTPVKHFSSGMYMRLAFAVAAHLDPEILIVDEVLTVGDAAFQKKCLGKMGDVASKGRTVLLVSHQMNQIRRLCDSCVWLEGGAVRELGPGLQIIGSYENSFTTEPQEGRRTAKGAAGTHFVSWAVESMSGGSQISVQNDEQLNICFRLHAATRISKGHHGVALFNSDNVLMWAYATDNLVLEAGDHEVRYAFPLLPVRPGVYHWQASLYNDSELLDLWNAIPALHVNSPLKTHRSDTWQGVLNLPFSMAIQPVGQKLEPDLSVAI